MDDYAHLSEIYDIWQKRNRPAAWADFTEELIRIFGLDTTKHASSHRLKLADLGCGTGGFAIEMSQRGYDVLAVDRSPEMLAVASAKEGANRVRFVCQDITSLRLGELYDVMVCYLDTVNHLRNQRQLEKFFEGCSRFLHPEALLIFDVLTPAHFKSLPAKDPLFEISDEYALIWDNRYEPNKGKNTATITAFVKGNGNEYRRFEEMIRQQIYTPIQIKSAAESAGLIVAASYGGLALHKPTARSKRIFYAVRKDAEETV